MNSLSKLVYASLFVMGAKAYAISGYSSFYCSATYSSINVKAYADRYIITLNVPVSQTEDGFVGDFVATIPGGVKWDGSGTLRSITATSKYYQQGRWNGHTGRSKWWGQNNGLIRLYFTPELTSRGPSMWAEGTLTQKTGRPILLTLGYCWPTS